MKHITLQGVDVMVSNSTRRVVIKDPLNSITQKEAESIIGYLFDEGFIRCDSIQCDIVTDFDEKE